MAIGTPTLKSAIDSGTNAASYTTSTSFTPTADNLYVAFVGNGNAAGATLPTLAGNSLTWTQVATVLSGDNTRRLTAFGAEGTGGTAGTQAASFGGTTQSSGNIQVFEVTGVDVSGGVFGGVGGAIIQAATGHDSGAGTTATATAATGADVDNRNLSAFKVKDAKALTPRALWTELNEQSATSTLETQWRTDAFEATSTATWSGSSRWAAITLEMKIRALGWGNEPWGNFRWGENPASPRDVTMNEVIDQMAIALEPVFRRSQSITGMGLIDQMAVALEPTSFQLGFRPANSLVNLRRGVRHGTVRGVGAFRSTHRVRGLDGGSVVRGNYSTRGAGVPSRTGLQITMGLIDNMAVALAPQALGSLSLPLIDNMAIALEPEFDQNRTVQLEFIDNMATVFEPSMGHVDLELIDNMAIALEPYIPIELSLIDNMAVVFTPQGFNNSGQPAQSITGMVAIDNMATALQPESVSLGAPQQVNLDFIDNMAIAVQMFIKQELPNVIEMSASYDDEIRLEASYDDDILKKVKILGIKAPITKLDDWNKDEDQFLRWELPADQNAAGWTVRFRLAEDNGAPHILEYAGTITASTEITVRSLAGDTSTFDGNKVYFYELARTDTNQHQRIAHGPAWLGERIP